MVALGPAQAPASLRAVVLAGGEGSRMPPLSSSVTPKALLPIANRPMLFYPLVSLLRAGLRDIVVVSAPDSHALVEDYVANTFANDPVVAAARSSPYVINVLQRDPDAGTADAVTQLPPSDHQDVLVISSDTVLTAPLDSFIAAHRLSRASCTVALSQRDIPPPSKPKKDPKSKSSSSSSSSSSASSQPFRPDHYALLTSDGLLLALHHPADLEASDTLRIPASTLVSHHSQVLRTDLFDPHIYLFHAPLLHAVLNHVPAASSLKYDLVPYLARRQAALERLATSLHWPLPSSDALRVQMHLLPTASAAGAAHVALRANTVPTYMVANVAAANLQLAALLAPAGAPDEKPAASDGKRQKKGKADAKAKADAPTFATAGERTNVGKDCIIGASSTAGSKTSVKKSVVGMSCSLGDGVKLNSCVLMNEVSVANGTNLASCIVCNGASIGSDCVLKDCRIAAGVVVADATEVSGRDFVLEEVDGDKFDLGDNVEFC